jgi:Kef-type K+ transport system membrane component KefB
MVTVLMFLMVTVAAGVGSGTGGGELAFKFVLAGVLIAILFLAVRPALAPLGRACEERGGITPGMFAAIMILLFASAYAADRIGINVIVGSFLVGAVLPARPLLFRELSARLSDLTAVVLLPIFLAFSGLSTDFTKLGVSFVGGIALFLVAGIVGKWLGGAVFARLGGLTWAEGNVLGILMNCRGLLVLVVALIAFQQNVISAPMQVAGVLMALVTTMMTGPLFDAFLPRAIAAATSVEATGSKITRPGGSTGK